ncbi:MAG: N-acetylmuramoyl-L-alanine amidase [Oscillospiraceae bacterium]|nr:N-acetylmuramoyl-L-alanine amidase [Oscillospiraceae bacterium]
MQKKETWLELRRRARWDRIAGAFAVLLLLLILIISGISSCTKKLKKSEVEPVGTLETQPAETQPATEEIDNSMAVFLSPSTQEDNLYACDKNITEEKAMWMIARRVKTKLEEDGIQVYICGEDDDVPAKVKQGNKLRCGAYVAIHSNSSGESGTGEGTECFYNSDIAGSLALAENIYNRVASVTPTDDRGVKDQYQRDLYEIFNNVSPCCLLEVEFHDNLTTSRWILNHIEDLAQAIVEGTEAYLETTQYNNISADEVTEPEVYEEFTGDH